LRWLNLACLVEWGFPDGKLCLLGRVTVIEEHKLPREIVERRAQVMETVTDNEAPCRVDIGDPHTRGRRVRRSQVLD
jgi:hypothetical protein